MGLVLTVTVADQGNGTNTVLVRRTDGIPGAMRISLAPGNAPGRIMVHLEAPDEVEFVRGAVLRKQGISDEAWLAGAPGTERPRYSPRPAPVVAELVVSEAGDITLEAAS